MPGSPEAGKGRCCHPADTSGSCSWATGASWHPAFVRQGRRRGWAWRPSKQPDFRKPRATGPFPSHHSWREGKREKKKKARTSSAGKAARHPSRRQGCQSKQQEVKPQQSPRPSLTSLQEQYTWDRTRGSAAQPQGRRRECRLATASPRDGLPRPLQGRKGKKTNLLRRAIPGIQHAHTWAWIPRKPSSLNSTEAPQHSPQRCSQQSRHRYRSPRPTDA